MDSGVTETKTCPSCHEIKYVTDYYPRSGRPGLRSYCKTCSTKHHRKWVVKNQQRQREYNRLIYHQNPERYRLYGRRAGAKIRNDVLDAYGAKCQCCGECTREFLGVDHIAGDGAAHRKVIPSGDLYGWLKRQGYPKDNFQLLCHNCNFSKGHLGACPHTASIQDARHYQDLPRRVMQHPRDYELVGVKLCSACRVTKPLSSFYRRGDGNGYRSKCKTCYSKKPVSKPMSGDVGRTQHPCNGNLRQARQARLLRQQVIDEYGRRCVCCGESESAFMSIDHVDEDGAEHRRNIGSRALYRWLRKNGFPKDKYQLLCYNCNIAKHFYGCCPHSSLGQGAAKAKETLRNDQTTLDALIAAVKEKMQ